MRKSRPTIASTAIGLLLSITLPGCTAAIEHAPPQVVAVPVKDAPPADLLACPQPPVPFPTDRPATIPPGIRKARTDPGTASPELLDTVLAYVSAETRRPLTDHVTAQSAGIVDYAVEAHITTFSGPDAAIVIAEAQARLADYIATSHRLGRDVTRRDATRRDVTRRDATRSALFAALHVEGVQNVELTSPAADVVIERTQAPWCTGTTVTYAGLGE